MKEKVIYVSSVIAALFAGIIITICVYKFVPTNNLNNKIVKSNVTIKDETSISESIKKVNDAVVYIETSDAKGVSGSGTGFFYKKNDKKAYIITNNHVVEGSAKVTVTVVSGKSYDAKILGTDMYADIAVLEVDQEACTIVAEIGENANTDIGDTIFAVGSPLGIEYMNSVTKGIISGKDRTVEVSLTNGEFLMEVIQTDAAINPGNSGGPLCNVEGKVIGVNSLKLVEEKIEGMGFAIPIEYVMTIVNALETGKETPKPLVGVEMLSVGDTWQLYKNGITIDPTIEFGVVLVNVEKGKPADDASLQKGDVIIEFAGKEVKSMGYFRFLLYKQNVGDTVKIKYYRDGKIK
ncbi:MAG: trypsin-like peptidase domain-containing protein, partial [Bacilli bacterium]